MKKYFILIIATLSITLGHGQSKTYIKNGLKISPVKDSPLFEKATLVQTTPKMGQWSDSLNVLFSYSLTNYQLTNQTSDAVTKHCSNSAKGQHIHLILNNEPYLAKYDTVFTETLKEGNVVALSFLSRSYHESIKHKNAFQLTQFTVGSNKENLPKYDLSKPMIFYSRPKGEYIGEDAKKVLLDFYIVNCELKAKGYKVKVAINETEFLLDEWVAYAIEGMPMGENSISIELLNENGEPVSTGFNKVTRKIILK